LQDQTRRSLDITTSGSSFCGGLMGRGLLLKILAAITERRLTDRLHAGKLAERKQK
jgi:hypothetical protein